MRCPHSLASSALVQPTRLACSRCAPRAQRDARPFFSRRGGSQRARRHLPPVVRAQRRIIYYLLPRKHVRQRRRETAGAGIPGFAYSTAEKKKNCANARKTNKQTNKSTKTPPPNQPRAENFIQWRHTALGIERTRFIIAFFARSRTPKLHPEVRKVGAWCLVLGASAVHGTRFETMAILVKALKCATKRLHAKKKWVYFS